MKSGEKKDTTQHYFRWNTRSTQLATKRPNDAIYIGEQKECFSFPNIQEQKKVRGAVFI